MRAIGAVAWYEPKVFSSFGFRSDVTLTLYPWTRLGLGERM